MNVENGGNITAENNRTYIDAETWFDILFGWLAALSVLIAAAALEIIL